MLRFRQLTEQEQVPVKISSYSKGKGKGGLTIGKKMYTGVWKSGKLVSVTRGMKKSPVKDAGDYYIADTEDGSVKFLKKELQDSINKLIGE